MTDNLQHVSVLFQECLDLLDINPHSRYLDATFGGGGHSRGILSTADDVHLVALDRDPSARERSQVLSKDFPDHFTFVPTDFGSLANAVTGQFDGALFDLGLSSFQLDEAERGFSFRFDAPLDMRMDTSRGQTARDFLNTASEDQLVEAIRDHGEERSWRRVVSAIQEVRGKPPLYTTKAFADFIASIVRAPKPGIHPATKVFQGIRIAINDELNQITDGLRAAFNLLNPNGRLVVISFHSLEDRIVKRFFNEMAGRPINRADSRAQDERVAYAELLTKKPITPSAAETASNPRSRSAKLRALIKTSTTQ